MKKPKVNDNIITCVTPPTNLPSAKDWRRSQRLPVARFQSSTSVANCKSVLCLVAILCHKAILGVHCVLALYEITHPHVFKSQLSGFFDFVVGLKCVISITAQ